MIGRTDTSDDRPVVLITGAAGTIGSATARAFAESGYALFLTDRERIACGQLASDLAESYDAPVFEKYGDISDDAFVHDLAAELTSTYGRVNSIAAIAGISGPRRSVEVLEPSEWDAVLAVNLRQAYLLIRHFVPLQANTNGARSITLMSSTMAANDVLDGGAAYATSKAALLGLTRSAAFDLARFKIRVNAICAGVVASELGIPPPQDGVNTPTEEEFAERIPLGAVGTGEDIASLFHYLASSSARHITGSSFLIDGGQTLQSWANAPRTP